MTMTARVAWGLWFAFVAAFSVATYSGFNPPAGPPIALADAIWAGSFLGFPTAGALIVSRMPDRPLGWILLIGPLLLMVALPLSDLARVSGSGSEQTAAWFLWGSSLLFAAGTGPLLLVPLFLPDGRLPSPRWRPVAFALWGMAALWVIHAGFKPGPLEVSRRVSNPLGIEAFEEVFEAVELVLGPLALVTIAIGIASLVVRFRRAHGVERQQLKWLALGAAGVIACFGAIAVTESVFGKDLSDAVVTLVIAAAILSLPGAIAVAVLRARLYDIDIIVNRTLVYGALTAMLASAYLGIVVVLQRVLDPLTADSDIAIAGSTLAVAALFRPLRARVQTFIDHRFYRRKYNAAATLSAFSSHLREQVDLDSLGRELVGVVGTTMQPAHASLWLRPPPEGGAR